MFALYVLILTVRYGEVVTVTAVPGFESSELCVTAASMWRQQRLGDPMGGDPTAVCAQQTYKK